LVVRIETRWKLGVDAKEEDKEEERYSEVLTVLSGTAGTGIDAAESEGERVRTQGSERVW
jgi:hypothetical protein